MRSLISKLFVEMRDLVIKIFNGGCPVVPKTKTPPRIWLLSEGQDEAIPNKNMRILLKNPIKPGFRRPITLVPDEALDVR